MHSAVDIVEYHDPAFSPSDLLEHLCPRQLYAGHEGEFQDRPEILVDSYDGEACFAEGSGYAKGAVSCGSQVPKCMDRAPSCSVGPKKGEGELAGGKRKSKTEFSSRQGSGC